MNKYQFKLKKDMAGIKKGSTVSVHQVDIDELHKKGYIDKGKKEEKSGIQTKEQK